MEDKFNIYNSVFPQNNETKVVLYEKVCLYNY